MFLKYGRILAMTILEDCILNAAEMHKSPKYEFP